MPTKKLQGQKAVGPEIRLNEDDPLPPNAFLKDWDFWPEYVLSNGRLRYKLIMHYKPRALSFWCRLTGGDADHEPKRTDVVARLYVPDDQAAPSNSDEAVRIGKIAIHAYRRVMLMDETEIDLNDPDIPF
ncbi:MAG: hypothetical protein AB7U61_12800 [Methylocystis sp.]